MVLLKDNKKDVDNPLRMLYNTCMSWEINVMGKSQESFKNDSAKKALDNTDQVWYNQYCWVDSGSTESSLKSYSKKILRSSIG